ncbi:MAG TPA: hypothetical protein PLO78_06585 [Candidatus Omnitrophota bacterium]|nr:hypothetical protein [Candidatus Omnitrophota bacterium]
MKKMTQQDLLDSLSGYGYPLVSRRFAGDPTEVLENLLRQSDPRLLEGFPVVLVNAMKEKETLSWERSREDLRRKLPAALGEKLRMLLEMTGHLVRLFGLEQKYSDRTEKLLHRSGAGKQTAEVLERAFARSETVSAGGTELSTQRLKENFKNYVVQEPDTRAVCKKKQEMEYELLLSEIFTARQKEVLKKRLAGKAMTKTEKEYFYRVVKKRLKALAHEDLHQMAKALL